MQGFGDIWNLNFYVQVQEPVGPERNNQGFRIVGEILTDITGSSYNKPVKDYIGDPAGANTFSVPNLLFEAHGGLFYSSIHDMALFARGIINNTYVDDTTLADPALIMVRVDYFVVPRVDLEANIGFKYSSLGTKFHIRRTASDQVFSPFVGTMIGLERGMGVFQVPAEVQFICHKGFSVSANISELIYLEYSRFEWLFEVSLGYRFNL
ncbi:MAG: hypothetical protein ISS19_18310 [Bacteroidales bacterium]|nr:hypothetical protein [Bacteroidales bacterium]